jgi:hypothetical protein
MRPLLFMLVMVCFVGGGSVAADTMQLEKGKPPYLSPYAYYMSVGPRRAADPDTSKDTDLFFMRPESYNLRVTLSNCERSWWMTISEIVTRRADTREVIAEYHLHLSEISKLIPGDMEIFWLNATSFAWITRGDTVVVEHKGDSEFEVTVRYTKKPSQD